MNNNVSKFKTICALTIALGMPVVLHARMSLIKKATTGFCWILNILPIADQYKTYMSINGKIIDKTKTQTDFKKALPYAGNTAVSHFATQGLGTSIFGKLFTSPFARIPFGFANIILATQLNKTYNKAYGIKDKTIINPYLTRAKRKIKNFWTELTK